MFFCSPDFCTIKTVSRHLCTLQCVNCEDDLMILRRPTNGHRSRISRWLSVYQSRCNRCFSLFARWRANHVTVAMVGRVCGDLCCTLGGPVSSYIAQSFEPVSDSYASCSRRSVTVDPLAAHKQARSPAHLSPPAAAAAAAAATAAVGLNCHHYRDCLAPRTDSHRRQGKLVLCIHFFLSLSRIFSLGWMHGINGHNGRAFWSPWSPDTLAQLIARSVIAATANFCRLIENAVQNTIQLRA